MQIYYGISEEKIFFDLEPETEWNWYDRIQKKHRMVVVLFFYEWEAEKSVGCVLESDEAGFED